MINDIGLYYYDDKATKNIYRNIINPWYFRNIKICAFIKFNLEIFKK
jgi:hypothetical protein